MAEVHSDEFYYDSDIDWFYRVNGINIHVASMGHKLPRGYTDDMLKTVYAAVSKIDMAEWREEGGVWYNEELLRRWLRLEEANEIGRYLASFVVMARKGFYSFAPLTIDPMDEEYYLMAKPARYENNAIEGMPGKVIPPLNIDEVGALTAVPLVEWIDREWEER